MRFAMLTIRRLRVSKELDSHEYNTYLLVAPDGTRVYSRIDWHDKIRDKLINTLKKYDQNAQTD